MNPKQIVEDGYDKIGAGYAEWASRLASQERAEYTAMLLEKLAAGADVLELGCGSGVPTTRRLAERFSVTGVDISAIQIALARQNVPNATFIVADMTRLSLPPASFEAVTAFYSIFHVPRREHFHLLQKIASWLRPGGWLVLSTGARSVEAGLEQDWLGAPMYWSSFDSATNCALVEQAGFRIASSKEELAEEFGQPVRFLWVAALKPC